MLDTTPVINSSEQPVSVAPQSAQSSLTSVLETSDLSDVFRQLAKSSPIPQHYWRQAVRRIASQYPVVGFAAHGQFDSNSIADFACVETVKDHQKIELQAALHESLIETECQERVTLRKDFRLAQSTLSIIGIPYRLGNEAHQLNTALTFCVTLKSDAELILRSEQVRFLLAQATAYIPFYAKGIPDVSTTNDDLDRVSKLSQFKDTQEFSYSLVASLVKRFECSQVAFGLASQHHVRVIAVSGMDHFKSSSPGIIDIQQAMEEASDQSAPVVGGLENGVQHGQSLPIHEQWAVKTRSSIVSIPLMLGERCIAVATLLRESQRPFSDEDIQSLQGMLKPFAAAVEMSRRADRGFKEFFKASLTDFGRQLTTPKTRQGLAARLSVACALLVFLFGWMPYNPATPCIIQPAGMTQVMATDNMILTETLVRSGDLVKAGQVLARFDTDNLEAERAALIATQRQSEIDVRKALTTGRVGDASLAKANAKSLECQIKAIEAKISQCHIVAPMDGMVVEADLSSKVGQLFAQGDKILAFAPTDQWELQLHIPERLTSFINADQIGVFSLIVTPGDQYEFAIESISGTASVVDGKNVVTATARVVDPPPTLRHGLKGVAKTRTGWKPICWVALHSAYEYACSWLWV